MKIIVFTDKEYDLIIKGLFLAHEKLDDQAREASDATCNASGIRFKSLAARSSRLLDEGKEVWALRKKIKLEHDG